jgi:hypothetical protein
MRKFVLTSLMVLTAVVVSAALAEIPETTTIDDCADAKAAVEFPHKAHFDLVDNCTVCHHTNEGLTLENAAEMEVKSCGACHTEPEKAETPKCAEKGLKTNPFHISCVGCHKDVKKEKADTTAPTKCNDCHPKG